LPSLRGRGSRPREGEEPRRCVAEGRRLLHRHAHGVREEARRIAGRLEATLRIPDGEPRGIAVVSHPLPTHGGTMRNPVVAAIARAIASAGLYALRFTFRGVGGSSGRWTGGLAEVEDLDLAIADARALAP